MVKFTKAGYFGAGRHVVTGEVFDKDGNVKYVDDCVVILVSL